MLGKHVGLQVHGCARRRAGRHRTDGLTAGQLGTLAGGRGVALVCVHHPALPLNPWLSPAQNALHCGLFLLSHCTDSSTLRSELQCTRVCAGACFALPGASALRC